MKITKESTGTLTALLKFEIGPDDYAAAVEKQIGDYKRKANIPGFRPGHIPTGLIKKMYGKAILADGTDKEILEEISDISCKIEFFSLCKKSFSLSMRTLSLFKYS